jgi:hypothetical protein
VFGRCVRVASGSDQVLCSAGMSQVRGLRKREPPPPVTPVKPRGRKGGRKRSTGLQMPSPTEVRMQKMLEQAGTPDAKRRQAASLAANTLAKIQLEEARQYKEEHGIGVRPNSEPVTRVVYVKAERKRPVAPPATATVDHLLLPEQREWLGDFVRKYANTKNGVRFVADFIVEVRKKFERDLSVREMSQVLHFMGFSYGKLRSDYYFRAFRDPWNVVRRNLLVPLLHYLFTGPACGLPVVVWNFDEAGFYVEDHVSMGWYDNNQPLVERRTDQNPGKGPRFSVSAFLSAQFGVLVDKETGEHVGKLEWKGINNTKTTAELMDTAGRVLAAQYPEYFHVIQMDSARIHAAFPADACVPKKINLSDGGTNRVADRLFGSIGLKKIFSTKYPNDDTSGWRLERYRAALWEKPAVMSQKLLLEEVLEKHGVGMIFNPIAHPIFAAIELLWRDIKWDYKTSWVHKKAELEKCLRSWLAGATDPIDAELAGGYFRTARGFVDYYLHGGTERPSEREVKRAAEDQFSSLLPDGASHKVVQMSQFYNAMPQLPRTLAEKMLCTVERLRELLLPYFQRLNNMRVRKSLAKDEEDGADDSSEDGADGKDEIDNGKEEEDCDSDEFGNESD